MLAGARKFLERANPLAAFRETRGLVAGSLTGTFFSLMNIFRVSSDSFILGKTPASFTAIAVVLASLFRVNRNLNQYESAELTAQEKKEHDIAVKGSATLIYNALNALPITDRMNFFKDTGISNQDWEKLDGNETAALHTALMAIYNKSESGIEKYSFSVFCGIMHFFGHFGEANLAQVFNTRFDLFDYRVTVNDWGVDTILFWGALVPFAAYNAAVTVMEVKASYDNPSANYLRQTILQNIRDHQPTVEDASAYRRIQA